VDLERSAQGRPGLSGVALALTERIGIATG